MIIAAMHRIANECESSSDPLLTVAMATHDFGTLLIELQEPYAYKHSTTSDARDEVRITLPHKVVRIAPRDGLWPGEAMIATVGGDTRIVHLTGERPLPAAFVFPDEVFR